MFRVQLNQMASLLYPAACAGCREPIARVPKHVDDGFESNWCDDCWVELPEPWQQGCPKCGSLITRPEVYGQQCALCRDIPLRFDSAVALGNYQGMLKRLVLELKRDMNESLAWQLGRLLGCRLMQHEFFERTDLLLPVPIHWKRRLKRGFHAASVIAEGVRATTGVSVGDGMLSCQRLTQKQGTLTGQKRFDNVKHAFKLRPLVSVAGSKIVIVDDVMTSGATLSELARMLRKAGAEEVHCAVLARGTGNFKSSIG